MNFQVFGLGGVLVGLAALAAGLFALQRVRVRHREFEVATTLFWQEAIEKARARSLVERFRHPLAYLLVLLIAGLLWLAVAGPQARADARVAHVVMLDGSAAMGVAGRLDQGRAACEQLVERLPRATTEVVFCGGDAGSATTLLAAGEHEALLAPRLAAVMPVAAPGMIERTLDQLVTARGAGRESLRVWVIGPTAPRPRTLPELELSWQPVRRAADAAVPAANSGIVECGASDAASGNYGACDVLVTVARSAGAADARLRASLDDQPLEVAFERLSTAGSEQSFALRDVPARGGVLEVSLVGDDALALDDTATLVMPRRRVLTVWLDPALATAAPALRIAIEVDPAVRLASEVPNLQPDVAVVGAGVRPPVPDLPVLAFEPGTEGRAAFVIRASFAGDPSVGQLQAMLPQLGLDAIDATELAAETGRVIGVEAESATGPRRMTVWAELIGGGFDWTRSEAFPLVVSATLRWLGGVEAAPAWVAAGEPLDPGLGAARRFTDGAERAMDPVGAEFVPPRAGAFRASNAAAAGGGPSTLHASLVDVQGTAAAGPVDVPTDHSAASASGRGADLVTWLGLLALLLLVVEWVLYRNGRMP